MEGGRRGRPTPGACSALAGDSYQQPAPPDQVMTDKTQPPTPASPYGTSFGAVVTSSFTDTDTTPHDGCLPRQLRGAARADPQGRHRRASTGMISWAVDGGQPRSRPRWQVPVQTRPGQAGLAGDLGHGQTVVTAQGHGLAPLGVGLWVDPGPGVRRRPRRRSKHPQPHHRPAPLRRLPLFVWFKTAAVGQCYGPPSLSGREVDGIRPFS